MTLGEARLYLVSPARLAAGALADLVPDLAAAGVDVVQLREKDLEAGDLVCACVPVAEACAVAGIPFIVNDRPDVALAAGADGVHLGRKDLPVDVARRILGSAAIVGCSTHSEEDIAAVAQLRPPVDYIAVGPLYPTPTKPGRPPTGLGLVRHAAERVSLPWFAIGGIDRENLPAVIEAGARRIVVVRAVTEAKDPVAAAAELRSLLDGVALT